jgi:hypothetical protein
LEYVSGRQTDGSLSKDVDDNLKELLLSLKPLLIGSGRYSKPAGQPTFRSIALGRTFRAEKAASIIVDADPNYPGIVEVLLLGFCGWTISPSQPDIAYMFLRIGALEHVDGAEEQADLFNNFTVLNDIIARYNLIGVDFLQDVYYPTMAEIGTDFTVSRSTLADILETVRKPLGTLVKACEILHYHASYMTDLSSFRRISLTLIIDVLSSFRDDGLVERTVFYEFWTSNKSSLALLYAASTIRLDDGENLLNNILTGEVKADEFASKFELWLARARHFTEDVLPVLRIPDLVKANSKALKCVPKAAFDPPELCEEDELFLRGKFQLRQ